MNTGTAIVKNDYVRAFTLTSVVVVLPFPRDFEVQKGEEVYVYSKPNELIVSKKKLSDAGLNFLFKRKVQENNTKSRFIYLPRSFSILNKRDLGYELHNDYIVFDVSDI